MFGMPKSFWLIPNSRDANIPLDTLSTSPTTANKQSFDKLQGPPKRVKFWSLNQLN